MQNIRALAQSFASSKPKANTITSIWNNLRERYSPDRVKKPISFYFSLGGKEGPRYTVTVSNENVKSFRKDQPKAGRLRYKGGEELLER